MKPGYSFMLKFWSGTLLWEFCFKLMGLGCKMFSWSLWSNLFDVWGCKGGAEKEELEVLSSNMVNANLGLRAGAVAPFFNDTEDNLTLKGEEFDTNGELELERVGELLLVFTGELRLFDLSGDKILLGEDILETNE